MKILKLFKKNVFGFTTGIVLSSGCLAQQSTGYAVHESAFNTLENVIRTTMNSSSITAASVAVGSGAGEDSKILFSKGFGTLGEGAPTTQSSVFRLGSLEKMIAFYAMEQMIREGVLNPVTGQPIRLTDEVHTLFKDFGVLNASASPLDSRFDQITIRHLLEHRSGLVNVLDNSVPTNNQVQALYSNVTLAMSPPDYSVTRGSGRIYSNAGFVLLRYLVELISGDSQNYIQQNIFTPVNSFNAFYLANTAPASRLRDSLGVLREPINYDGWVWNTQSILEWAFAYTSSAEAFVKLLQHDELYPNPSFSGADLLPVRTGSFEGTLSFSGSATLSDGRIARYVVIFNRNGMSAAAQSAFRSAVQNALSNISLGVWSDLANVSFENHNNSAGSFASWARSPGVEPISGDFNGDGKSDIALFRKSPGWGSVPVSFRNSDGWDIVNASNSTLANLAKSSGVNLIKGDYNGDGKDDVALISQDEVWSDLPIAFANGDGSWNVTRGSAGVLPAIVTSGDVLPIPGDYNNDGKTDIAFIKQSQPLIGVPVALSNGDGSWDVIFGNSSSAEASFASWATTDGAKPIAGDYNGDGLTDIALVKEVLGWNTLPAIYANGDGTWTLNNNGISTVFTNLAAESGVKKLVGDFNGDGLSDIALLDQIDSNSPLVIGYSNADKSWRRESVDLGSFAGWATHESVEAFAADFNNDGTTDIALVKRSQGWNSIPIAFSNYNNSTWDITNVSNIDGARWARASGTKLFIGDADNDNKADVSILRQEGSWGSIPVIHAK